LQPLAEDGISLDLRAAFPERRMDAVITVNM